MIYDSGVAYDNGETYDSATVEVAGTQNQLSVFEELRWHRVAKEVRVAEVTAEIRQLPIH